MCSGSLKLACWAFWQRDKSDASGNIISRWISNGFEFVLPFSAHEKGILRSEIGWFDTQKTGELSTRLAGFDLWRIYSLTLLWSSRDTQVILDGMGSKVGNWVHLFCTFIAGWAILDRMQIADSSPTGMGIGLAQGWQLTLVSLSVIPLFAAAGTIGSH